MPKRRHSEVRSAHKIARIDSPEQMPQRRTYSNFVVKMEQTSSPQHRQIVEGSPPNLPAFEKQLEKSQPDVDTNVFIKIEPILHPRESERDQPSPPIDYSDSEPMDMRYFSHVNNASAIDPPSYQTLPRGTFEILLQRIWNIEKELEYEKAKNLRRQERHSDDILRIQKILNKLLLDDGKNTRKDPPDIHSNISERRQKTSRLEFSNHHSKHIKRLSESKPSIRSRHHTESRKRDGLSDRRPTTSESPIPSGNLHESRPASTLIPRDAAAAERRKEMIRLAKLESFPSLEMETFKIANRRYGWNKDTDCLCCEGRHSMIACPLVPLAYQRRRLWRARKACLECRGVHPNHICISESRTNICHRLMCRQTEPHAEEFCDAHPLNLKKINGSSLPRNSSQASNE